MKILLVEDELELANFLIRGFRYEGYYVEHVDSGQAAIKVAQEKFFDVMVLDLKLPDINGDDVVKELNTNGYKIPIIVLTGVDDIESKVKLLNLGADDYLVKPFSFVELNVRVRTIVRRSKKLIDVITSEIKLKHIRIIPKTRTVYSDNSPVKLRMKEYDLLVYLMQHPDEVISRTVLIEKVWDYNARVFSNTVDSHISVLRKKLSIKKDNDFIETIHGVGYMLRSESDQ